MENHILSAVGRRAARSIGKAEALVVGRLGGPLAHPCTCGRAYLRKQQALVVCEVNSRLPEQTPKRAQPTSAVNIPVGTICLPA